MAQITIEVTAAQATRIAICIGRYLGYRDAAGVYRPATAEEIRAFLIHSVRKVVLAEERKMAESSLTPTPFD